MSTKPKTKNKVKKVVKKVVKKSPASKKKKSVKSVKKTKVKKQETWEETFKALLPPKCECYSNDNCEIHDDIAQEYAYDDTEEEIKLPNLKYYYAVNHTTKQKALITGEELPYEYAVTVAERVTEDTTSVEKDDIHVAEVGPILAWIIRKVFKVTEYEI